MAASYKIWLAIEAFRTPLKDFSFPYGGLLKISTFAAGKSFTTSSL
ncbi:MAG: hypothetical protein K0S09_448 [Sphingobacteriaceae bacterium]|nr:hypothetical protein [Sphingobacteriaceae bacterium]